MVLLNVLGKLAPAHGWKLTVAHFNHQLRGRNSDADEKFVRQAAKKLGLPVMVGRADIHKLAAKEKLSIEMAARKARHEFFARTAKSGGIPTVALAHHANDQIELFLLRMLRGAGGEGLAGMKWLGRSPASPGIALARPLLDLPRTSIAAYAKEHQIKYREDASNAHTDILRNRVRLKLIPLLIREYQPALEKILLRESDILGAESDYLNNLAIQWLGKRRRQPFDKLPVALQRRCLQLQIQEARIAVNFELLEKIRLTANRAIMAGEGISISRDGSGKLQIKLEKTPEFKSTTLKIHLKRAAGTIEFGGAKIRWKREKTAAGTFRAPTKVENCELFDARKAGDCMVLRHWRAGDRFQPLGMAQAAKLQDLFTNRRILRERRREMVVATTKTGEIIWVEGLPPGERFKLDKSTVSRLNWQWKRL